MGLKYGCVEDVITGLSIQSQGWKSVYYNPARKAFLGVATTTLGHILVQHKRWFEADFQILLSKNSPAWYDKERLALASKFDIAIIASGLLTSCRCSTILVFLLFYLLKGISSFPQLSSPWFIPFAYVIFSKYSYSLVDFLWKGGTVLGRWNDQRIWLYKRTSSYLLAFIHTVANSLGFSADAGFVIAAKVSEQDVHNRYLKEIMEFEASSPMFTILATSGSVNLLCLVGLLKKMSIDENNFRFSETMLLQILLCSLLVLINWPLYQGLFLRKDNGKMPSSLAIKSIVFALLGLIPALFSFLFTM